MFSVCISSDGEILASGGKDKTIKLWNIESGENINTLKGHTDIVRSVKFSPDGKILASGGYDNNIILWKVSTGKEKKNSKGP